jgi:hypothetical protein
MLEKPFKSRIFRGELIKVIVRNYVFFFFFKDELLNLDHFYLRVG